MEEAGNKSSVGTDLRMHVGDPTEEEEEKKREKERDMWV